MPVREEAGRGGGEKREEGEAREREERGEEGVRGEDKGEDPMKECDTGVEGGEEGEVVGEEGLGGAWRGRGRPGE